MKFLSEKDAFERLRALQTDFAKEIRERYEHRAKSCLTCETPGACCLDAHFVNVRISRLEARLIEETLQKLPEQKREGVYERIERTVEKYDLSETEDNFEQTFACPLFEKGIGCLVHIEGKPLPCIHHACYERQEDLPPDELLAAQELLVNELNIKTYGGHPRWLPLPVALLINSSEFPASDRHRN